MIARRFKGWLCAGLPALVGVLALATPTVASAARVVISPLPGTRTAEPGTQVSFLGAAPGSLSAVAVVGSVSGRHSGTLRAYTSAAGESFIPSRPFLAGESVRVSALWSAPGGGRVRIGTGFAVASPVAPPNTEFPTTPGTAADVQAFLSRPDLHPPVVTVHQAAGGTSAPGDIFATPALGPGQWGPMIFDAGGRLVWFHPVKPGLDAADLRTQVLAGRQVLTWWQGRTITLGYGLGVDVVADANYRTVALVRAGNGLRADEHEFTVTPRGTAWVEAYQPVRWNLSPAGGPAGGTAVDCVIQEVDIHTGLVMWEWHSLGHVEPAESYSHPPTEASGFYDYFHLNSIDVDAHGNLLVSARNTWAIYDIDHLTGTVRWRLGGRRSSFSLGAGVQFAYQHNALWLGPDLVSLFDDEGAPPVAPPSRGEVVRLDTAHRTATLATSLVRTSGPLTTGSQGDMQPLPGGGWMVGWGGLPNFTEFDAQGKAIFDAQLPAGENSYRVYRLPWVAQPLERPALAVRLSGDTATAYASWNGATTVDSWQLLVGADAHHLAPLITVARTGFETSVTVPAAPVFKVRALSAAGRVLAVSPAVSTGA